MMRDSAVEEGEEDGVGVLFSGRVERGMGGAVEDDLVEARVVLFISYSDLLLLYPYSTTTTLLLL